VEDKMAMLILLEQIVFYRRQTSFSAYRSSRPPGRKEILRLKIEN